MSDRFTANTITSAALDELYTRAERAEAELARLHEGEEDGYAPHAVATPGQWIYEFNRAPAAKRLAVVATTIQAAQRGNTCFLMAHEKRLAEQPGSAATEATGPRVHCGQLKPATIAADRNECVLRPHHSGSHADEHGARWWYDPALATPDLVVEPYRNDRGDHAWCFRCWGTDTCDGWLSLDHYSQQSAERARDRHVAEEHPTKEQP